jgi:hypothetical protein
MVQPASGAAGVILPRESSMAARTTLRLAALVATAFLTVLGILAAFGVFSRSPVRQVNFGWVVLASSTRLLPDGCLEIPLGLSDKGRPSRTLKRLAFVITNPPRCRTLSLAENRLDSDAVTVAEHRGTVISTRQVPVTGIGPRGIERVRAVVQLRQWGSIHPRAAPHRGYTSTAGHILMSRGNPRALLKVTLAPAAVLCASSSRCSALAARRGASPTSP